MVLKLQGADGMGDVLNGVLNGMGEVIHGVNAPFVPRIVMAHVGHPVDHRIPHINIGGSHVDLCPEHLLSVLVFSFPHLLKQPQVLLHGTVAVRALLAGSLEISPVFPDLIRRQIADKRLSLLNEKNGALIHLLKIVGGEKQPVLIVGAQPLYVLLDGLHEFHFLFCGIGIVKPKVKLSAVLLGKPVV